MFADLGNSCSDSLFPEPQPVTDSGLPRCAWSGDLGARVHTTQGPEFFICKNPININSLLVQVLHNHTCPCLPFRNPRSKTLTP